jgi:hypothetical protein
MAAAPPSPLARAGSGPELAFGVLDASPLEHAAVPTLRFGVRVDAAGGAAIRSILLHTQVRIAARRRAYGDEAKERLFDLFGAPGNWASSLRTLLWAQHTQVVPPFTGETTIDVPVPCTYDFDVAASRYLAALDGGDVPLELLFSGTVFYAGDGGGLQTARIAWDREAEFRMPVAVWRATMERHFADTAWLRLRTETLERLQAYRSRKALTSMDAAIESLLGEDG